VGGDAAYEQLVAQVVGMVEAPAHGLALPLDVRGTAFQQRVWLALREIPAGKTETYSNIAERIGSPRSVRAVAGACAANAHAVAIRATASSATTAGSRAIAGGWNASAS
jgi:AraC family transcriptional regulator of adaptative response/methylated-DNA-[protein]-cysteine methyltransferase